MKKILFPLALILFIVATSFTGKYITKNGNISFYSDAPLEKIEAKNSQVNAALDSQDGALLFKVLIKSFIFEKALMQEHFNENYLEVTNFQQPYSKGRLLILRMLILPKKVVMLLMSLENLPFMVLPKM